MRGFGSKGLPTKLIEKKTVVDGVADPAVLSKDSTASLPVHTLTFEIPKNGASSSSGGGRGIDHKDIRVDLGDIVKMVIPGYKPKSYSVSALRENEFDVTVKVYPNGRSSGYLDRLKVGDYIDTFALKSKHSKRNRGPHVGLIAYGVGITEVWPIAKAELKKPDAEKVVVLWATRTWADTFWHDEMDAYKKEYPEKLKVVHIISREQREGCLHGRVDPQVLSRVFSDFSKRGARFLSVGTKGMMSYTRDMLEEIGYESPANFLFSKDKH